jgi:7-carboxy-7-deazaguanine synthase
MTAAPTLKLAESFISIQGEGKTVGTPAVFWRFSGCPFTCVWCDTVEVWRQGTRYSYPDLYDHFQKLGHFSRLNHHSHHLVITGGDPLLQQGQIVEFLDYCALRGERVDDWYIECENQAFLKPDQRFVDYVSLWNISPKLSNSGMSEDKRTIPSVVEFYVNRCQAIFKFPISGIADLLEVLAYQRRFSIQSGRIWLMPVCSSREQHEAKGKEVAEICIQHGLKFSPRLQLVLWDASVGV